MLNSPTAKDTPGSPGEISTPFLNAARICAASSVDEKGLTK